MDSSWEASLPYESDLRYFVHLAIINIDSHSLSMPTETRPEINFSGTRPGKLSLRIACICFSRPMKNRRQIYSFCSTRQQIVEYDLVESLKQSRGLVCETFVKRIFQSARPVSMTLVPFGRSTDEQLLVADDQMKFKLFDKNTFEILATFLGPIYDSYVQRFVSIYGATTRMDWVKSFHLAFAFSFPVR